MHVKPVSAAGPGSLSLGLQRMYSLMYSMLKLQESELMRCQWPSHRWGVLVACTISVSHLWRILRNAAPATWLTYDHGGQLGVSEGNSRSGAAPATEVNTGTSVYVSSCLPALGLLGRCGLLLSDLLEQRPDSGKPTDVLAVEMRALLSSAYSSATCAAWLRGDGNAQHPTKMGFGASMGLVQKLLTL
jgi:hypothetical protein